jgi:uncharacterized protein (DUF1697 family)
METCISILRGINVSGQKKILMADLKEIYTKLGFKDPKTYIQSGNIVFKSDKKLSETEVAQKIEKAIEEKYNFHVPVIIRTLPEIKKIIAANPFLQEKDIDLKKLHVTFLSEIPTKENLRNVENIAFPPDEFIIQGKEIYLHIPESYGETKLSNSYFEKKLKVTATTRNWNTVNTLMKIAEE